MLLYCENSIYTAAPALFISAIWFRIFHIQKEMCLENRLKKDKNIQ